MYIPYQGNCARSLTAIESKPLLSGVESEKQSWGNLGRPGRSKAVPGFHVFAFAEQPPIGHLYTQEVDNYRVFLELTRELVEVNEKICELRPARKVEDEVEMEALKTNCSGGLRGSGAGNSQDGRGYVIQPGGATNDGAGGSKGTV